MRGIRQEKSQAALGGDYISPHQGVKPVTGGGLNGHELGGLRQVEIHAAIELHADRPSLPRRRSRIEIDRRAHLGLPAPTESSLRKTGLKRPVGNNGIALYRQRGLPR